MWMGKSMSGVLIIRLFWLLSLMATIGLGFCYRSSNNSGCIPSEKEALLKLKHELKDPSNRLATWVGDDDGDGDCCGWYGVICNNLTGHVLELRLGNLSPQEYYASGAYGDYLEEYYMKLTFGGKISPSLLNLQHLRLLDLSNNDFGGIQIPEFLGSIESLRYLNLSGAGFGGMVPQELGNLSNLQYLNLKNGFYETYVESFYWLSDLSLLEFLDLSCVNLSQSFNWLEVTNKLHSLAELHLSNCSLFHHPSLANVNFSSLSVLDMSGNSFPESLVPNWIFRLKSLESLNLASNQFQGPISEDFGNLTSLQRLDLSLNSLNSSVPKWLFSFDTLVSVSLAQNQLEGPIPNDLQNIASFKELDLSYNYLNSSIPNWLFNLSNLEHLNLSYNNFQGKIPSNIGDMTSLVSLDLSFNKDLQLHGGIPSSFKNFCNLKSLILTNVNLSQNINDILAILKGCVSDGLESLDLYGCQLFGHLSSHLGPFQNLVYLSLAFNSISGPIPLALGNLKSLKFLFLHNNMLSGPLPVSLGGLANLQEIHISYNLLEGNVSEIHFAKLSKLRVFDASYNHLLLRVSSDWTPPPLHLQVLRLGYWRIGPLFPRWLHALTSLCDLDLSSSGISSSVPFWFWNSSVHFSNLNLSHNQIPGIIPDIPDIGDVPISNIDFSSNLFQGPLPLVSPNAGLLDLSNNSFSGDISHYICYKTQDVKIMGYLDLGNNLLSGEIPDCWSNWSNLASLRLSNNNFSGNLPKSIGTLINLQALHLRNDNLSGEISLSLKNFTGLISLDLGENKFTGHIPPWLGAGFPSMVVLNLRENKFHGLIPKELCQLAALQILDLAHNYLYGTIPTCIDRFSAMTTSYGSEQMYFLDCGGNFFLDYATIVMKGRVAEYTTILKYVKSIDLSGNNLSGAIPEEVIKLAGLQSLNLSDNCLSGKIPDNIGSMSSLEAMDLSQNQLSGEIPQSMTNLTFLSLLNLSNNDLTGKIPSSTQFQSLSASSFTGNRGLCGPPLENCNENGAESKTGNVDGNGKGDGDLEVDWFFYASVVLGFILGFWGVLVSLGVSSRWRNAYYNFLYRLGAKCGWV